MAGEGRRAMAGAAGLLLVMAAGLLVAGEIGAGRLGGAGAGAGVLSGRTELLEKVRMTQLLGNATEVQVEFPADYPNSVRHFLLIGFLAQVLASALIFFMSLRKGHESMPHALAWLAPAIGALAYLAMWAGVAVWYKASDETPRVIFWPRYINHILGTPVSLMLLLRSLPHLPLPLPSEKELTGPRRSSSVASQSSPQLRFPAL
eukprot:768408-Hanusia_phi.AAC.6